MGVVNREWRPVPVPGCESDYEVSNFGEVISIKTGHRRPLKPKHNNRTGYDFVILGYRGNSATKTIHRLVAEAFIPNPDGKPAVNHINEVKTDNRASNLEWVTIRENNEWSKHKRNKPVEVWTPDGELIATFTSQTALARFLNVSKSAVSMALNKDRSSCCGFILKYGDKEVD